MKIKSFLISVFIILFSIGVYLNFRYLEGVKIQENSKPLSDNFYTIRVHCSKFIRDSSYIILNYNSKEYQVEMTRGNCEKIENKEIKPTYYYNEKKDIVFFKDYYVPIVYVYLTYISAFILPLIGFIVYRKELNNNYKTM